MTERRRRVEDTARVRRSGLLGVVYLLVAVGVVFVVATPVAVIFGTLWGFLTFLSLVSAALYFAGQIFGTRVRRPRNETKEERSDDQ